MRAILLFLHFNPLPFQIKQGKNFRFPPENIQINIFIKYVLLPNLKENLNDFKL